MFCIAKLLSPIYLFPVSEEFEFESILSLTFSLRVTHWAGINTCLTSNSNISKMVKISNTFKYSLKRITTQKMKFSIRISSVIVDKSAPADLLTFTEEILDGKLHFLCNEHFSPMSHFYTPWKRQKSVLMIPMLTLHLWFFGYWYLKFKKNLKSWIFQVFRYTKD